MVSRVRRVGCATCFLNLPSVVSEVQRVSCRPLARWRRTRVDKTMLPLPCDMQPRMRPTRARETRHARARTRKRPKHAPTQASARPRRTRGSNSVMPPTHASAASVWRPLACWRGTHVDRSPLPPLAMCTHACVRRTHAKHASRERAHASDSSMRPHKRAHDAHESSKRHAHDASAAQRHAERRLNPNMKSQAGSGVRRLLARKRRTRPASASDPRMRSR
jgi:hypothetical protein